MVVGGRGRTLSQLRDFIEMALFLETLGVHL
jgi:hypothetical protein